MPQPDGISFLAKPKQSRGRDASLGTGAAQKGSCTQPAVPSDYN